MVQRCRTAKGESVRLSRSALCRICSETCPLELSDVSGSIDGTESGVKEVLVKRRGETSHSPIWISPCASTASCRRRCPTRVISPASVQVPWHGRLVTDCQRKTRNE